MCDEKKFYEETNHMIDARDIYGYIKMMINPYGRPFEGTIFEFGNKLMDYIIRMEKQPKVGKWIPCSKRLPKQEEGAEYYASVIVTVDDGRVAEGVYTTDKEWWVDAKDGEHYSENLTGHVIAWMPLPEPYKGE